jgi:hypothetical protein
MLLQSTTKHENGIESRVGQSRVTQVEVVASAPSLKGKLTGETWSHHHVSHSTEQHAEEVLC